MALRGRFGASSGEIMREDAHPCSLHVKAFSSLGALFGGIVGMPFCYMHYGPLTTRPRLMRWSAVGAASCAAVSALHSLLWEPACEPQNVAAYDHVKKG